ncbi:Component of a membrane-bound complex containing the Tor2p kinase [Dipsacomyces acuminosporus]|nr:Component of a membrane-bound complex containing the Tor2p kinase [Dipsacomyces acuminosporus]
MRQARTDIGMRGQDGLAVNTPTTRYPDGAGKPGRNRRTNRNAKVAPTQDGGEEVLGVGMVPQRQEMIMVGNNTMTVPDIAAEDQGNAPPSRRSLDTVRPQPSPALVPEEVADSGSMSDGAGPIGSTSVRRPSVPIPLRRSLDVGRNPAPSTPAPKPSTNMATIRLQRPTELMRKGSSRDAIALGIDFDVKSIFESGEQDGDIYEHQYKPSNPKDSKQRSAEGAKHPGSSQKAKDSEPHTDSTIAQAHRQRQAQAPTQMLGSRRRSSGGRKGREDDGQTPRSNSGNIELRAKRSEASFKIPLGPLREDRSAGSSSLKRSATMPARRHGVNDSSNGSGGIGSSGSNAPDRAAGQRSKWAGGNLHGVSSTKAFALKQAGRGDAYAPGWVGGAPENSWDHSDGDDDSSAVPASRRGGGTQTWYVPRSGIRPISMFPMPGAGAVQAPPMPVVFGAGDSDDDIDLEGDEGSSKTPALIGLGFGRGLRPHLASPNPSIRSRASSLGKSLDKRHAGRLQLSTSVNAVASLANVPVPLLPGPSAVSNARYDHLIQDTHGSRPRGRSDPEGRQSMRNSIAQAGSYSLSSGSAIDAVAGKERAQASAEGSLVSRQRSGSINVVPANHKSASAMTFGRSARVAGVATAAASQATTPAEMADASEYVPPPVPQTSGLAALLASSADVKQNPFAEEFGLISGAANGGNALELKVLVFYGDKRSKPLKVRVRQGATVEQAIGFALYQYIDEGYDPPLEEDIQDVVMWALRIADDGEIDDDFPALDRTRPVAKFAFDEFVLCLATPEQIKLNEDARERQGRSRRMAKPSSGAPAQAATATTASGSAAKLTDADRQLRYALAPRVEYSHAILRPSLLSTMSTAIMFVGTALQRGQPAQAAAGNSAEYSGGPSLVSGAAEAAAAAAPSNFKSRLLKIHVLGEPSSAEALRTTTIKAGVDLPISQVLSHVCRKWAFSEDEYVLGILDKPGIGVLNADMLILQIPPDAELCLYRADGPLPSLDSLARARQPAPAPLYGQQPHADIDADTEAVLLGSGDAVPSLVYRTFPVIRRAQMFARHERSLVIDGEVVTLMPSDHRTDTTKTLTFHISNVTCKRNQRSPKKVKLLINRSGNTGEKSLDLEAMSEEDAMDICTIINRLHQRHVYKR